MCSVAASVYAASELSDFQTKMQSKQSKKSAVLWQLTIFFSFTCYIFVKTSLYEQCVLIAGLMLTL